MTPTENIADRLSGGNDPYAVERVDLACAVRWAVRFNWHEAVANHFSLSINEDGTRFLLNPRHRHFATVSASDFLIVDANDRSTLTRADVPDETAWGLHGSIHRRCTHARCVLHIHPTYATVLASLANSTMPPIDQNSAQFFNRMAIDDGYGGLAFEEEGERCAALLGDPKKKVLVMGNHGVTVIGATVADAFNRLYHFERAAETVVKAYWTGRPLRLLPDAIAEKTAREQEKDGAQAERHFDELKAILDREEPGFRD